MGTSIRESIRLPRGQLLEMLHKRDFPRLLALNALF